MILISFFMIVGYSKKTGFARIEWAGVAEKANDVVKGKIRLCELR